MLCGIQGLFTSPEQARHTQCAFLPECEQESETAYASQGAGCVGGRVGVRVTRPFSCTPWDEKPQSHHGFFLYCLFPLPQPLWILSHFLHLLTKVSEPLRIDELGMGWGQCRGALPPAGSGSQVQFWHGDVAVMREGGKSRPLAL